MVFSGFAALTKSAKSLSRSASVSSMVMVAFNGRGPP